MPSSCWSGQLAHEPGPRAGQRILVHLPLYSPELNLTEKIWQLLRERFLSHRVFRNLEAVIAAACAAWNRLVAEPKRVRSPTAFPWLPASVTTSRGQ